MNDQVIRQACKQDTGTVSRFLADASVVHKHLDWKEVLDWLEEEPFLLLYEEDVLEALLSCAPDPPGINWIHCFASRHLSKMSSNLERLLNEIRSRYQQSIKTLYSVGLQDWYCKSLENYGFEIKQNIVVLSWNGSIPVIQNKTPQILLRPMEPGDLEDVFWLDNLAFEPLWSFSNSALQKAYQQSEHATVAELDENIIGYELTTANHFSAHLARLAVHPEYTNKNIGSLLVIEMLAYFSKNGQKQITVNTQNDNSASLAVYKKLGFSLTGDTFPVYQLHIN